MGKKNMTPGLKCITQDYNQWSFKSNNNNNNWTISKHGQRHDRIMFQWSGRSGQCGLVNSSQTLQS